MLIDSHCHLNNPKLAQDVPGVLARARQAGVAGFVTIGTTRSEADEVIAIAEANQSVYCSVGVHPHEAAGEGEQVSEDELVARAAHPKVIGLGETGLDYFYEHSPREIQRESFRRHLRAAARVGLPVIVHTRDAEEDTALILTEEQTAARALGRDLTGVLHCFSSGRKLAEDALALGFYISLSGIITFKKSVELRDIAHDVPMDRLLVETDAPWLAPEPHRGKPCEPAHVVETARVLAQVKGVSYDEIAARTTENFLRLFSKVSGVSGMDTP
ncbi:MAG: TatD family hydrolase [Bdellovibrionales bacterium]